MVADRAGNLWVRRDGPQQVAQSRRRLTNPGRAGGQMRHAGGEDHEGESSGQGCRRSEDRIEAGLRGGLSYRLGAAIVIADQVGGGDAQLAADVVIGQVQHGQAVDDHLPDTTPYLEGVDAGVGEVAEQLCPRRLLLVGGIPGPRVTTTVVAAVGAGGVSER